MPLSFARSRSRVPAALALALAACLLGAAGAQAAPVRMVAGAKALTDSQGRHWSPAGARLDGRRTARARGISWVYSTPDLYKTAAVGATSARVGVSSPGRYAVTLYLVDPGARPRTSVFDVLRSDGTRLRRVTVPGGTAKETAPFHAAVEVPVRGRNLNVRFRAVRGRTAVTAVEVQRLGPVSMAPVSLRWQDSFDGAAGSSPDPSKWAIQTGSGWGGAGFPELQEYTDTPANVSVDGSGTLDLTARRSTLPDGSTHYTSARIDTRESFDLTRAIVTARMKVPPGKGFWPIFWAWFNRPQAPKTGEIDVAEMVGREPNVLRGYVHGTVNGANPWTYQNYARRDMDRPVSAAAHTFEMRSEPGVVEFFVDGSQYGSVARADIPPTGEWVVRPGLRFNLIFSLSIGGWAGNPDASTPFPAQMAVERVSVRS